MKIIITEEQKKKLFIPRKLTQDDSRYSEWNKEQPIIDGVQINQYDPEGRKQGYWMTYYEDKLYSKGNYINGLRDGYWGFYNGLGVIYQKAFYKNGKLINKNLPLTESDDKKKLFIPRKLSSNDSRYSDWNNSQPIKDGVRINQYNIDGRKQGYWEEYYSDGNIEYKGNYKNGKEDGYWEYYWENGKIYSKGSYIDGSMNGIWIDYHWNGNLDCKDVYKDGFIVKEKPITEEQKKKLFIPRKIEGEGSRWEQWNNSQPTINGKKINQYDLNGKPIGYWDDWIDDEMVSGKGFFIKGLKHGMWEEYLSGELIGKGIYKNGKESGIWELYDDGKLDSKVLFDNGKVIGKWQISKDNLTEGVSYSYTLDKGFSDPTNRRIIYRFKNKDNYEFEVIFYNLGDNKWEREYSTSKNGLGLLNTNDVFNIIETVTEITIDFIEKYEPNNITIFHIRKNKEVSNQDLRNMVMDKPSKRALLNKRYLKPAIDKLDDYFYYLKGSTSVIEKI